MALLSSCLKSASFSAGISKHKPGFAAIASVVITWKSLAMVIYFGCDFFFTKHLLLVPRKLTTANTEKA